MKRRRLPLELLCALLPTLACGPVIGSVDTSEDASSDEGDSYGPGPGGDANVDADGGPGDPDAGPGGDPDAGADETAGDTDTEPPPEPGVSVLAGNDFIDAFFADEGLLVVQADGVILLSRSGEVVQEYESPRTIESAAFEGQWLGVADQAVLTTFDLALGIVADTTLVEGCSSAVMVSGPRFVCGPENDWDRILYTYDALSGELLGTSAPYTYNGIPMRRVPGTDDFVTVTHDLSPSDFHLYSAAEDPVVFVNESPYHGDFAAGLVQAYVGVPATHLVNSQGIMLRIYGEDCVPGSPFDSQCFIKDGELGTLPPDAYGFIDLREGFDGYIYGLVDPAAEWPFDPPCVESPCELQRIDPATRTIVATAPVVLGGQEFAVLRPDPQGGSVAIVAGFGAPFTYSFEDFTTFDVFFVAI